MLHMIPPAEALSLQSLITPTEQGTSPFDALVIVLEGSLTLTIGGTPVRATPGPVVLMPADIPHALEAPEACRMLLIMLRGLKAS